MKINLWFVYIFPFSSPDNKSYCWDYYYILYLPVFFQNMICVMCFARNYFKFHKKVLDMFLIKLSYFSGTYVDVIENKPMNSTHLLVRFYYKSSFFKPTLIVKNFQRGTPKTVNNGIIRKQSVRYESKNTYFIRTAQSSFTAQLHSQTRWPMYHSFLSLHYTSYWH